MDQKNTGKTKKNANSFTICKLVKSDVRNRNFFIEVHATELYLDVKHTNMDKYLDQVYNDNICSNFELVKQLFRIYKKSKKEGSVIDNLIQIPIPNRLTKRSTNFTASKNNILVTFLVFLKIRKI